ncbi:MAG: hypothetical protein OEZ39_07690 [Gammaproteobacteria bacterium]|nr:hypothetical protein [Gammaproteobacteria bacterium]MDH5651741.1 hypothetical protein [Gammaproteobacteria bacterium]
MRQKMTENFMHLITAMGLLVMMLPLNATAAEAQSTEPLTYRDKLWNYLTDDASITVGLGGRGSSVTVTRIGTNDTGKLVDNEDAWFLSYNTRAGYFKDSNFGYSWMFNLSSFEARHQELESKEIVNLNTRVQGYFAYLVPAVFYNFGAKQSHDWFRIGIGLGLGLAEFDGDIILTSSATPNDRVAVSNGPSNLFGALGFFIEWQRAPFTIRLAAAGPGLKYNGYEINVADTSLMLGYTHYLNWR